MKSKFQKLGVEAAGLRLMNSLYKLRKKKRNVREVLKFLVSNFPVSQSNEVFQRDNELNRSREVEIRNRLHHGNQFDHK